MNDISFRAGDAGDIDAVMAVMDRAFDPSFGEAWNRAQCLGLLPIAGAWLILAETEAGRVIGFALCRLVVDDAELLLLAVDPAWRGRQVGAALIARSAAEAGERGAARLLLEVRATNPALALYRRAGFAQIGRRRDYYRGGDGTAFDALTLARALSSAAQPLYEVAMIPGAAQ